MKLIVGLGNPGDKYARTRHNVGFWVIDELCKRWSLSSPQVKWDAYVYEHRMGTEKVLLVKPQTFMNLSGESVRQVVEYYSGVTPQDDVMVTYDDMDIPCGQLRLRLKGSAGGHNGMKSLIQHLGTTEFPRLKIGIGRPDPNMQVISHVLSGFTKEQLVQVEETVRKAAEAIEFALENSFSLAMNRFN